MSATQVLETPKPVLRGKSARPKVGFLGVGWIGRNRLEAVAQSDLIEIAAIADPAEELRRKAAEFAPSAELHADFEALLAAHLDALVIATPSAMHAAQALQALEQGLAVFCQKPLGRSGNETRAVVECARQNDRLLGVDLYYRHINEVRRVCELARTGELGKIYAADLVFHNAYGPDKPWFYDRKLSGGGCVMDLGIHLVDLALWTLDFPRVVDVSSRLFVRGEPRANLDGEVEDFAQARLDLASGATVQLACSWKLPAGRDAVISGTFYGTNGAAAFSNVNGSFYEFVAERFSGTRRESLAHTNENWGGKAIVEWARKLASGSRFDSESARLIDVAETLDRIYGAPGASRPTESR
jgi:predicted dehydrogenase